MTPQLCSPPTFVAQPLPTSPPPNASLPAPPASHSAYPARSASRSASISSSSIMSGLPGSTSMSFPHPPSRVSPVPSASPPPSSLPPPLPIRAPVNAQAATPARIADAWREGEERDRRQRAEQARLEAEAEANFGRLRLGQRNGSIATTSSGGSSLLGDQSRRPSTTPSSVVPSGVAFSLSPTESIADFYRDSDVASFRTNSSGADSGHTQTSSEKAVKGAATVGKVIKRGLFAGLMAQPEFHQAGTAAAPVATGPPARKVYPAPRPKYPTKGKKGANDASSLSSK